jgi:biopolymer transport protein ExbD
MVARRALGRTEINAGSMADIAFLLLIFFLVTTTMSVELGILRILPPYDPMAASIEVPERNVHRVVVNDAGELLVEDKPVQLEDLKTTVKEFLTNPSERADLPELKVISSRSVSEEIDPERKEQMQNTLKMLGAYRELPANAIISLQTGSKTKYDRYVQVQNELTAAVNELRNELSITAFWTTVLGTQRA